MHMLKKGQLVGGDGANTSPQLNSSTPWPPNPTPTGPTRPSLKICDTTILYTGLWLGEIAMEPGRGPLLCSCFQHMAIVSKNGLRRIAKSLGCASDIARSVKIFRGPNIPDEMRMHTHASKAIRGGFNPVAESPPIARLPIHSHKDMALLGMLHQQWPPQGQPFLHPTGQLATDDAIELILMAIAPTVDFLERFLIYCKA